MTRVTVLGVVCLCPKVQLSLELPSDEPPDEGLFLKSTLGSDFVDSLALGKGKCHIALIVFLSGVFCVSLPCFGVGEPHTYIWLKEWEGKGLKRPFLF